MTLLPQNRFEKLRAQTHWNGIDFVEVALVTSADRVRTELHVHFINPIPVLRAKITAVTVTREGTGTLLPVTLHGARWEEDEEARPILRLRVLALPADPGPYTLTLTSAVLDPYFAHAAFSFTASFPSDVDCVMPASACPPLLQDLPPIDYLAKDFLSFRKALSDFSALRYPEWQERSEADFGVMFMEALCSLADDLSYTQDRIAAEAHLETATQRRSLIRHARLLDYEPRPHTSSRVWLQFDVIQTGRIPAGLVVSAHGPDGAPIPFETGTGLRDQNTYPASPRWNRREIQPYFWDPSQVCLKAGATSLWVRGHGFGFESGQLLLIETEAQSTADLSNRERVMLVSAVETADPLGDELAPTPLTYLTWRAEDALKSDHDLTRTQLAGNLAPATQGRRFPDTFVVGEELAGMPPATWRSGPNGSDQYLRTLPIAPLAWLAQEDPNALPQPEIQVVSGSAEQNGTEPSEWRWVRRLLDCLQFDAAFTLDPARFRTLPGSGSDPGVLQEYDDEQGETIRFGDDVFGETPDRGTVFQVAYRVGGGTVGNVTPDAITNVDPKSSANILAVTNPWAAEGGTDQETAEQVRRLAPQAFRAKQMRAVKPGDYQAAAETLPWAQRAGTQIRWTGSWNTVFTTVEPQGAEPASASETIALINLLNRRRIVGYPSYVLAPRYVALALAVTVQARDDAFRSDVQNTVSNTLSAVPTEGSVGFFDHYHFPPGTPLERSALSAAIQNAFGVAAVLAIEFRRLDRSAGFQDLPATLPVGKEEIVRVDNDPRRPGRGFLQVFVEGGK